MNLKSTFVPIVLGLISFGLLTSWTTTAEGQSKQQIIKGLTTKFATKQYETFLIPMKMKEAIQLLSELVQAGGGAKIDIVVDQAAFKAQNPDAPDILDTTVIFPRMQNIRMISILRIALSQYVVPTTIRIDKNRLLIVPGKLPPLRDMSKTSSLRTLLLKQTSAEKTSLLRFRKALDILGKAGNFTVLVSNQFKAMNPDQSDIEDRTVKIPATKKATYWQFIVYLSNQVEGVPVVQEDHVIIVPKNRILGNPAGPLLN